MNKTININLAGFSIIIDENAFLLLEKYLKSLKDNLEINEKEEIIQDIEYRIYELFQMKTKDSYSKIISLNHVEEVIQKLGNPDEIAGDSDSRTKEKTYSNKDNISFSSSKRLFRYSGDKILGGICSGISIYLGINDPIWIRILFIIVFFATGGTIAVAYIIGIAIIPEAKNTADLLDMKGVPFNIESIEKNFENLREELNSPNINKKMHSIVEFLVNSILIIIAGVIIFIGILFIPVLFWIVFMIFSGGAFNIFEFNGIVQYLFQEKYLLLLLLVGIVASILVPAITFVMAGIGIITKKNQVSSKTKVVSFVIWILGGFSVIIVLFIGISKINSRSSIENKIVIANTSNKTMKILSDEEYQVEFSNGKISINGEELVNGQLKLPFVSFKIEKSATKEMYIIQKNESNGKNNKEAKKNASEILSKIIITDSTIYLPRIFEINNKSAKFRGQNLEFTLFLPEGNAIFLDNSLDNLMDDIENLHNMLDDNMLNHIWEMTPMGLVCKDCGNSKIKLKSRTNNNKKGKIMINGKEYEVEFD